MAIRIDRAVGWLPDRIGREVEREIARGRGPLAEIVLPLNQELLSRQTSIDLLTQRNEKLQAEVSALRASHARLVEALQAIVDIDGGDKPGLWDLSLEFEAAHIALEAAQEIL